MIQKPIRKINRKLTISASLLFFVLLAILLQSEASRAKDDWLPVPPEDLALKDNPASPGAHAMILYREDFIDAKQAFESEYIRIKIFTEEGKKRGNVSIEYVKGLTGVADIRARTIRPDGSVVNFEGKPFDKEIVKAGGIKVLAKSFDLPDVQPGCIIEYKYREQHDANYYWNVSWTVGGELFTRLARYSIKPDTDPGSPPLYWRKYMLPGSATPDRQKDGTLAMEVKNLPGIEDEDLMPPGDALRGRVEFFYRGQYDPANETPDQYWKRIGKAWNALDDAFIDKKGALQSVVSQTVSANDTADVKLQKLYTRVQKIRNVSYDTEKTAKEEKREKLKDNNNVDDVLKRNYASGRQLNLLMMGLARAAGFDSAMLYVAPRSGPPFLPNMEDSNSLHAELVWVHANDRDFYLDPASKFYPYGLLPWYETGVTGIKPTKQGADMIEVPRSAPADAVRERHADLRLDADGSISGTVDVNFAGMWGCAEREDEREEDEAGRKKDLADIVKAGLPTGSEFEISSISGWDEASKPVHIEGKIHIPGFATQAGHRTLVPVTIFLSAEPGHFAHEKRVNPIFFRYPYTEKDSVSLRVPDGIKIESVPPEAKASPGGGFNYGLKAAQSGNSVSVERQLAIGGVFYLATDYPALRSFFNSVKTHDDTQIVLHSAQSSEVR
jgi:hypothetical protein